MAAALQAVDGIAAQGDGRKRCAAGGDRPGQRAALVLGATAMPFGIALLDGLAIAGGASAVLSGIVMAFSGFSDLEMAINMPASARCLSHGSSRLAS